MDSLAPKDTAGNEIPANVWEKWGVASRRGYQAVPHDLFRFQAQLQLSNGELVTLLNILDFWYRPEKAPFPGVTALAKRMGTDPRSVQRHLKTLEEKGYATREPGRAEKRNFRLDGLVKRLGNLVKAELGLADHAVVVSFSK
ncbi:helix-turn-helix domain-containing protein [Massilia glaciei]|uniref:Helix-turn-helix domain-containing protein n=1 Tax=Massilia glaciei TaxID=1524097 RepID=A0A2U2I6I9_9BURK|nr:helix-turn-helix domain-containing protein [Massilia glaciei]PWF55352.1 hypothetical protein C7C56_002165 [Massilia glaciei]